MAEDEFETTIRQLYAEKNWKSILNLKTNLTNKIALKYLWVWPTESNLIFFKRTIQTAKLNGIISIGCGCGLLEWLIQQSTGYEVIGYEVNREWWASRYSNRQFIQLQFPTLPPTNLNASYALLFCYFNDGEAFRQYIAAYAGRTVIIMGPGEGAGRHTDPEPFRADFGGETRWVLEQCEQVGNSQDFIAVYKRK